MFWNFIGQYNYFSNPVCRIWINTQETFHFQDWALVYFCIYFEVILILFWRKHLTRNIFILLSYILCNCHANPFNCAKCAEIRYLGRILLSFMSIYVWFAARQCLSLHKSGNQLNCSSFLEENLVLSLTEMIF